MYGLVQFRARWIIAYQVGDQPPIPPKNQRLRNAIVFAAQICDEHFVSSQTHSVRYAELPDEASDGGLTRATSVIYVETQNFHPARTQLVGYSDQLGRFLLAWRAPSGPKIDYQYLASIVRETDSPSVDCWKVEIGKHRFRAAS